MKSRSQWRVSKDLAGMSLLSFLKEKCVAAPSVKALKRAIDAKSCSVNGRIEIFSSFSLSENDLVSLSEGAFEVKTRSKKTKLSVLYEDDELLICNKSAGVTSEKSSVLPLLPSSKKSWELVHRLDKETTGALIIAKTSSMKQKMMELFRQRKVQKAYLAIVDGVMAKEEGTIDNFLGRIHSYQGQTIYGAVDPKKGLHAITHWKCLKRAKTASLVWCEPLTGRTHQLRVHFSGIGHPILGDTQYGKRFRCSLQQKRNLLHAYQIRFVHPSTGDQMKVIAPIPADFKQALDTLKR